MKQGIYKLIGNTFLIENRKYLIRDRKNNINKPKQYLSIIFPGFQYVSSLYPIEENLFRLDYNGKIWEMNINLDKVEIKQVDVEVLKITDNIGELRC